MAMGRPVWRAARSRIQQLLAAGNAELRDNEELRGRALLPLDKVEMKLPAKVGDYTDFYSSREHATNVGTMFRGKDNALQPNWCGWAEARPRACPAHPPRCGSPHRLLPQAAPPRGLPRPRLLRRDVRDPGPPAQRSAAEGPRRPEGWLRAWPVQAHGL